MAQHRAIATGKHRTKPATACAEIPVADHVDATMQAVEPSNFDPAFYLARTQADRK